MSHVALVLQKVKLEVEGLDKDVTEQAVERTLKGGIYQSTTSSKIQHLMKNIEKESAEELVKTLIKDIGESVRMKENEQKTIVTAVLSSQQYATTHTTIGRDGKIAGYYVKVISQWDEKRTVLCIVASYFRVDHYLGPTRTITGYRDDALRACKRVCEFNATTAMVRELQQLFLESGMQLPQYACYVIEI